MCKDLEIRSYGTPQSQTKVEEGRMISGLAIVFNSESKLMYDKRLRRAYREVILPEAVTEALLSRSDVRCLYNHDRNKLLARCRNGEGTLQLSLCGEGLRYSFEAPNTPSGSEVLRLVERGDLYGSSFSFALRDEDYSDSYDEGRGVWVRHIHNIPMLFDVSVVIDPAYMATSCESRCVEYTDDLVLEAETERSEAEGINASDESESVSSVAKSGKIDEFTNKAVSALYGIKINVKQEKR